MFAKLFKTPQAPLKNITAPTEELLPKLNASPEAKALFQPGQSPGEYLQVLEQNQKPMESVNLLSQGMPEKDAVKWASESSKMVGDKLNSADQKALAAAEKWLANPTPETQNVASLAAAETNGAGPGGWAAQAAAWAKPATQGPEAAAASGGAGAGAGPAGMAAAAAAGAVMLAAGLGDKPPMADTPRPKTDVVPGEIAQPAKAPDAAPPPEMGPAEAKTFSKKLKPFLELGKKIASGAG